MDEGMLLRMGGLPSAERVQIYRALSTAGHPVESLPVPRLAPEAPDGFLLLEAQQRLLTLERLRPQARFNRIEVALRLKGDLDADALVAAFADVVLRHEGLRTVYRETGEGWRGFLQWDHLPGLARESGTGSQALEDRRRDWAAQPFDLAAHPPWRALLLALGPGDHALLLTFHHLVLDGFGIDLMARDVGTAYRARLADAAPAWTEPAARPREAAVFERDLAAAGLARPAGRLAAPTAIPADRLRLRAAGDLAGVIARRLPAATGRGLAALARATATPVAAGPAAAALVAIGVFAGSPRVEAAIAVSGRDHPHDARLVAPCVRAAPIVLSWSFDQSAETAVTRAAAAVAASLAAGPLASGEPPPCLIVVQNANGSIDLPGIAVSRIPPTTVGAHHALVFTFVPDPTGWTLELEYALDLFEEATAAMVADGVILAAEALAAGGESPLSSMLPDPERVAAFALPDPAGAAEPPFLAPIASVTRWAGQSPDAPAVLSGDGKSHSYAAILSAAMHLAETWAGSWAGAGRRMEAADAARPVALLAEHGVDAVIALLAAALSGRPFVVLEPQAGLARARALLEASGAGCLAADPAHRALAERTGLPLASLAATAGPADGRSALPGGAPRLADGRTAYIAFTSGSTGAPKGIVQSERSFAQFLSWQERAFGFGPGARVAMWSSLVFDACYTEVFGALAAGATLCIPAPGARGDPAAIARWLADTRVTYFLTIPSFLSLVLDAADDAQTSFQSLRDVATSGEPMLPGLARRLARLAPRAQLHNLFGPTEAVLATRHIVPPDHPEERRVPVGRPLHGRRIHVLDPQGRPLPPGASGEIVILSDFLADGYVGDDGRGGFQTTRQGERCYLTGDIGRLDRDGNLHFLGRRDGRAKIRGMLVDLAEIAAILEREGDVAACQPVTVPGPAGPRLVVHLVLRPPASVDGAPRPAARGRAATLRQAVVAVLGPRAAPALFVVWAALPRTATGKVDIRKLEGLDLAALDPVDDAPAQEEAGLGALIAAAWQAVLGRLPARDEPFFDAGGDSLLAVKLHAALATALPGRFTLVDLFANPTIEALAAMAAKQQPSADPVVRGARERAGRRLAARRIQQV